MPSRIPPQPPAAVAPATPRRRWADRASPGAAADEAAGAVAIEAAADEAAAIAAPRGGRPWGVYLEQDPPPGWVVFLVFGTGKTRIARLEVAERFATPFTRRRLFGWLRAVDPLRRWLRLG